ncbi:MAG: hypothetical protein HC869_09315 [Rhodospirillales bacterium]|nr:hypothetical protein [Rhodospirillales bacterium]
MRQSTKPLGAYAIMDALGKETGEKNYANSIYRVLVPLVANGEAIHVVSAKGWIAADPEHGPAVVLLCAQCGQAEAVCDTQAVEAVNKFCAERGFTPNGVAIELVGCCAQCQGSLAH